MGKSIQQQRNELVLQRLLNLSNEDDDWAEEIADLLEWALDEHASNDGFGTEGQMDPRGDKRNEDACKKYFTMFCVEGIDV